MSKAAFDSSKLMSVGEYAAHRGVARATIESMITDGKIIPEYHFTKKYINLETYSADKLPLRKRGRPSTGIKKVLEGIDERLAVLEGKILDKK